MRTLSKRRAYKITQYWRLFLWSRVYKIDGWIKR